MQAEAIPPTVGESLARVKTVESRMRKLYAEHAAPHSVTEHVLHGGMYARTVRVKAPQAFASVLIVPPTVLIVNGDALIYSGETMREVKGYKVLPAAGGRKAVWVIRGDTEITAIFPCDAQTVEEAEKQFTSEPEMLCPLTDEDVVTITGEVVCRELV